MSTSDGNMNRDPRYGPCGPEQQVYRSMLAQLPPTAPDKLVDAIRNRGFVGQDSAVRTMSLIACRHVNRIRCLADVPPAPGTLPPKQNVLMIGPTGTGKTFLAEVLFRDILSIPVAVCDATNYSETGYVGADVNTILTRLLIAADYNITRASVGIVFIDEFDKIASSRSSAVFAGEGTTKDVSGLGVQRELLRMLEATDIEVPSSFAGYRHGEYETINTRYITFVAAGSFSGLDRLLETRNGVSTIGFDRHDFRTPSALNSPSELSRLATPSVFYKYGFLPELIARFGSVISFGSLDKEVLEEIFNCEVMPRYQLELELDGIRLEVEPEVSHALAKQAIIRETGARGIEMEFAQCIENALFDAYCRIPEEVCIKVGLGKGEIEARVVLDPPGV